MGYALLVSFALILAFSRMAGAAARPSGTPGAKAARTSDAPQPAEAPGGAEARTRTDIATAGTEGAADIDGRLFLLDDDTIAALERELDACFWPPGTPRRMPPTDH